ncbi:ferredoxin [Candidatus Izemoplasma sp. B36]|uniref:(2Fe-2S) ferredoxin domain-containing protein n=1 Tax=Candidatus Izemoplasma sp. B36 TaxID=3242468 RepID=UPI00355908F3
MKTLEELKVLREESYNKMYMRGMTEGVRVQVGYGTCGIAAGAKPVYDTFVSEVESLKLNNVEVTKVGCMGECAFEPIVEIVESNGSKTIYCLVTDRIASEIIEEHIVKGNRIDKYLLSKIKR